MAVHGDRRPGPTATLQRLRLSPASSPESSICGGGVLTRSEFAAGCATRRRHSERRVRDGGGLRRERSSRSGSRTSRNCLKPLALTGRRRADFAWMLFASTEGGTRLRSRRAHNMLALDLVETAASSASARLLVLSRSRAPGPARPCPWLSDHPRPAGRPPGPVVPSQHSDS